MYNVFPLEWHSSCIILKINTVSMFPLSCTQPNCISLTVPILQSLLFKHPFYRLHSILKRTHSTVATAVTLKIGINILRTHLNGIPKPCKILWHNNHQLNSSFFASSNQPQWYIWRPRNLGRSHERGLQPVRLTMAHKSLGGPWIS